MTEATPPPARSVGQQVDDLVAEINTRGIAEAAASRDAAAEQAKIRDRTGQLAELVGRPAAAKILGMTPRELAGVLRGGRE